MDEDGLVIQQSMTPQYSSPWPPSLEVHVLKPASGKRSTGKEINDSHEGREGARRERTLY